MGNLRRYYYANKTKIWRGVLIVAFILVIIQVLNYFAGRKNTNKYTIKLIWKTTYKNPTKIYGPIL